MGRGRPKGKSRPDLKQWFQDSWPNVDLGAKLTSRTRKELWLAIASEINKDMPRSSAPYIAYIASAFNTAPISDEYYSRIVRAINTLFPSSPIRSNNHTILSSSVAAPPNSHIIPQSLKGDTDELSLAYIVNHERIDLGRAELYIRDATPHPDLSKTSEVMGRLGWRIDILEKGIGCTIPELNRDIVVSSPQIPLDIIDQSWLAYKDNFSPDLKIFSIYDAIHPDNKSIVRNEPKIRIMDDLLNNSCKSIRLQKTDYISYLMTDATGFDVIRSKKLKNGSRTEPDCILWRGAREFMYYDIRIGYCGLRQYHESYVSNIMGGSTLAFSRDGYLMIAYQTDRNHQSKNLWAPSGSGSFDWGDIDASGADDLFSLVRYGSDRELREECGLDADETGRPTLRSTVKPYGFSRMIHRTGKPEFFCIGKIDETARDLILRKPERYFIDRLGTASDNPLNLNNEDIAPEIIRICRDFLENHTTSNQPRIPISYPLEHGLLLLIEACENPISASAINDFMHTPFE